MTSESMPGPLPDDLPQPVILPPLTLSIVDPFREKTLGVAADALPAQPGGYIGQVMTAGGIVVELPAELITQRVEAMARTFGVILPDDADAAERNLSFVTQVMRFQAGLEKQAHTLHRRREGEVAAIDRFYLQQLHALESAVADAQAAALHLVPSLPFPKGKKSIKTPYGVAGTRAKPARLAWDKEDTLHRYRFAAFALRHLNGGHDPAYEVRELVPVADMFKTPLAQSLTAALARQDTTSPVLDAELQEFKKRYVFDEPSLKELSDYVRTTGIVPDGMQRLDSRDDPYLDASGPAAIEVEAMDAPQVSTVESETEGTYDDEQ